MTTNAFILVWDCYGLESAIPVTQYENLEKENLVTILKGEDPTKSPLNAILNSIVMRARFNTQRNYEVYAIDCDASFTEDTWRKLFAEAPQAAADLVHARGHKIFSDRAVTSNRVIV